MKLSRGIRFAHAPFSPFYAVRFASTVHSGKKVESSSQVLQTMNKLKTLGIKPDTTLYTKLLTSFAHQGDVEKTLFYFNQMQAEGIEADESIYAIIIEMYLNLGQSEQAQQVLSAMREKSIPISSQVYYIFFTFAVRANEASEANEALELMRKVEETAKEEKRRDQNAFAFSTTSTASIGPAEWAMAALALIRTGAPPARLRRLYDDAQGRGPSALLLALLAAHELKADEALRLRVEQERSTKARELVALEGSARQQPSEAESSQQPPTAPAGHSYYYYCDQAEATRRIDDASLKTLKRLANEGLINPSECFAQILRLYLPFASIDDVQKTCDLMFEMGVASDLETMSGVAALYASANLVHLATQVMDKMMQSGLTPTAEHFHVLVLTYLRMNMFKAIEVLIDQMRSFYFVKPNISSYNILLKTVVLKKNEDQVVDVIRRMSEDEIPGNEMTQYYLANILKLRENMAKEKYMEIQTEIDNIAKHMVGKINQNALYINFLLDSIKKNDRSKDGFYAAEKLFQQAERDQVDLDVYSYTIMIDLYGKYSEIAQAEALFQRMTDKGVAPSPHTWNSMLDIYAKNVAEAKILSTLERMAAQGVALDVVGYNSLFILYDKLDRYRESLAKFEEMLSRGIQPTTFSFHTLISICSRKKDYAQVLTLLRQMEEFKMTPDAYCYNGILEECMHNNDGKQMMDENGVKHDIKTYTLRVRMCEFCPELEIARGLLGTLREMIQAGVKPSNVIYTSMAKSLQKFQLDQDLVCLIDTMNAAFFYPDLVTLRQLILSDYLLLNHYPLIERILETNSGLKSDVVIFSNVLARYIDLKNAEFSSKLIDVMARRKYRVHPNLIPKLIRLSQSMPSDEYAQKILKFLKEKGDVYDENKAKLKAKNKEKFCSWLLQCLLASFD